MSIEAETNLTFAAFQYLKGDYKKNGDRQELVQTTYKEGIFFNDAGTSCPERRWMPLSWKRSRPDWMGSE